MDFALIFFYLSPTESNAVTAETLFPNLIYLCPNVIKKVEMELYNNIELVFLIANEYMKDLKNKKSSEIRTELAYTVHTHILFKPLNDSKLKIGPINYRKETLYPKVL